MEGKRRMKVSRLLSDIETDILDVLQCWMTSFKQISEKTSSKEDLSVFYDNIQTLMGNFEKLPKELSWTEGEIMKDICISLTYTVALCSLPFEGQMMCSTALCTALNHVLSITEAEALFWTYLQSDKHIVIDYGWNPVEVLVKDMEIFKICFCHGLLQSKKYSEMVRCSEKVKGDMSLSYVIFNLLEEACMKYSRMTNVAFKVLVLWLNKIGIELKNSITNETEQRISCIINSNWENPLSGVKEQNTKLFHQFLDVFGNTKKLLHHVMEEQPWKMKSKYFMLSVLLPRYGVKKAFADFPDLVYGLTSSLSYSHLVSAGSDMYRNCVKNMNMHDWLSIFLSPIISLLSAENDVISVEKQNVFNYWIPITLKDFPSLLTILLNHLMNVSQSVHEYTMFSLISLLKLGRKKGLLCSTWSENISVSSLTFGEFLKVLDSALQHSIELIRAEAFALVCTSTKTSINPSVKEFEFVKLFLHENVNADSSSLRQAILSSFNTFLVRLFDSGVHVLKKEKYGEECVQNLKNIEGKMSQTIEFFEWLHIFLISNLEPGTNYQRKILSLQIYKLVLSCFNGSLGKKKEMNPDETKVKTYIMQVGKWHFNSERSYKTLLCCVLDSTDDIRETAGQILTEYFSFEESNVQVNKKLVDYSLNLCSSSKFYETESGALLLKVLGSWTYKMPEEKCNNFITSVLKTKYKNSRKLNKISTNLSYTCASKNSALQNQEKLMNALENRCTKVSSTTVIEKQDDIEVNVKNKVRTFEGLILMDPSELEPLCDTSIPESTKIFEGLTSVSRDGLIGQRTVFPVENKPHISLSMSEHSGMDSLEKNSSAVTKSTPKVHSDIAWGFESENLDPWFYPQEYSDFQFEHIPRDGYTKDKEETYSKSETGVFRQQNAETFEDLDNVLINEPTKNANTLGQQQIIDFKSSDWPVLQHSRKEIKYLEHIHRFENSYVTDLQHKKKSTNPKERRFSNFRKLTDLPTPVMYIDKEKYKYLDRKYSLESSSSGYESPKFSHVLTKSVTYCDIDTAASHLNSKSLIENTPVKNKLKEKVQYKHKTVAACDSQYKSKFQSSIKTLSSDTCSSIESSGRKAMGFRQWRRQSPKANVETYSSGLANDTPVMNTLEEKVQYKHETVAACDSQYKSKFQSSCKTLSSDTCSSIESSGRKAMVFSTRKRQRRKANVETYSSHLANDTSKTFEEQYNGFAPLSLLLLKLGEAQLTFLKEDILKAAASGAPLHGTLTALYRLSVLSSGPEYGCMSSEEVNRTVDLLEQTVFYLLDLLATKSNSSSIEVAPSFADMDEAVKSSIQQSLSQLVLEDEDMQLSPAHQLVLNCIWLNLKACCNLASGLTSQGGSSVSISTIKRCGKIITQVLTRCRHKGAIESAGVALALFVKTVTSCVNEREDTTDKDVQMMLGQLLTEFLESLQFGSAKSSVTRRSAGLSILIHRIVANDMQIGKPLLHMCVSQLLDIVKTPLKDEVILQPGSVLVDLPQAQALHFLRILVQDSSLRQEMTQYLNSVAVICFSNFSSPVWTIRNASLQLSGALIPKLVGQKKIQDEEVTIGSGISIDEFFSHFKELTDFMLESLQIAANCHPTCALQQHADLIPMLSLLAKVAVGVEMFLSPSLVEKIAKYRVCFLLLISSPIYHVRKLAAKAYERFIPLSKTHDTITTMIEKLQVELNKKHSKMIHFRENNLNGILMSLKYLVEKLEHESQNVPELKNMSQIGETIKKTVSDYPMWDSITYFNKVLILELIECDNSMHMTHISTDEALTKVIQLHGTMDKERLSNICKPGLYLWASKEIEIIFKKCLPHDLISLCYNSCKLFGCIPGVIRSVLVNLKSRLLNDGKIDSAFKSSLFIALLKISFEVEDISRSYTFPPLFDVMLLILQNSNVKIVITLKELKQIYVWCINDSSNKSEYSLTALPLIAKLFSLYLVLGHSIEATTSDLDFALKLANCIKDRSDVLKFEEDFRLNAAKAVHLLKPSVQAMGTMIKTPSTKNSFKTFKEILLDVELTLLQDEDYNVRLEATKFVATYFSSDTFNSSLLNPYFCLIKLLEAKILLSLLSVTHAVEFLWKKLQYEIELQIINEKYDLPDDKNHSITSPFDHGTSNIYCEKTKMIDWFGISILETIHHANTRQKRILRKEIIFRVESLSKDLTAVLTLLKKSEFSGIHSTSSFSEACYIVVKKIWYQLEVMAALGVAISCDMENVRQELKQFLNL